LNHSELHLIDLLIIGAYLITMVSVGVYCVRRVKTTGDYYVAGRSLGPMVLMSTVCATIINMLGGNLGFSYELGACIACAVFIIYTATSGLFSVVYTDVLQFYMLLIFVYILIPIASLRTVVGFSGFVANLDPELIKPYFNGSIAGDIVTYLVFTMAGAEMWQRAFAARDRKTAKKGMFLGTFVYGLTIFLVFFMGMVAGFVVCVGWKLAGVPFGLGSAVPGAIACGIALVVVSLLTCKKHPSVYLKAHKELPPEASAE